MKSLHFVVFLSSLLLLPIDPVKAATSRIISLPTPTPTTNIQRTNIRLTPSSTPTIVPVRINALTTVTGEGFGLDINKIGQEKMLNPQPEPPIFDSLEIKKTDKISTLTWPTLFSAETIKSKVEFKPEGAKVEIPQSMKGNGDLTNLLIKPEFKISGNKMMLLNDGKQIELKSPPTAVYQRLNSILTKNKVKLIGDFTLDIKKGKAVYSIVVEEPVKLFGVIPMLMKDKILINDEDGKASVSDKPWFAFVSKEQVDMVATLSLLPNLVLKNIRFEPQQFGKDDRINVIATVTNEGLGLALGFPDIFGNSGGPTEVIRFLDYGESSYVWYPVIVYLEPGQTQDFSAFFINVFECGENIQYEIANSSTSGIEETTKEDNIMSAKLECNN